MQKIKDWIWHPFLFAIYPVLALLANNLGESRLSSGLRVLLLALVGASVLLVSLRLILRDWCKAAVVTTFTLVLFFSYGHVYNFLEVNSILGRHRFLLPVFGLLLILGIWWVLKKMRNANQVTELLNLVALVALVFPVIQIISFQIQSAQSWGDGIADQNNVPGSAQNLKAGSLPDVYYIVLDAYARGDTLQEFYGYDNSKFLSQLEELGFYVADCSQSNYAKTRLSLASTLNMDYLESFDSIAGDLQRGRESRVRMGQLIRRNLVRKTFESMGYTTVAFETGYLWSEWDRADIYLSPTSGSTFGEMQLFSHVNEFEALLFETTAGLALMDAESIFSKYLSPAVVASPLKAHYDRLLYTLDTLDNAASITGPKFVFVHLVSPHGPYVFTPTGEFYTGDEESETGYLDQVTYLNARLIPMFEHIIRESETPPLIILQADHGGHGTQFDPDHRMNILNAYYLPQGGDRYLYESISPVNSFRLVLSYYFGYDYELLEDVSYYSSIEDFFDFTLVPNHCITE
jgi:hypothetical protein